MTGEMPCYLASALTEASENTCHPRTVTVQLQALLETITFVNLASFPATREIEQPRSRSSASSKLNCSIVPSTFGTFSIQQRSPSSFGSFTWPKRRYSMQFRKSPVAKSATLVLPGSVHVLAARSPKISSNIHFHPASHSARASHNSTSTSPSVGIHPEFRPSLDTISLAFPPLAWGVQGLQ